MAADWSVQRTKDEVDRMLTPLTPSELAEFAEAEAEIEAAIAFLRQRSPPDIATGTSDALAEYWYNELFVRWPEAQAVIT